MEPRTVVKNVKNDHSNTSTAKAFAGRKAILSVGFHMRGSWTGGIPISHSMPLSVKRTISILWCITKILRYGLGTRRVALIMAEPLSA